MITEAAQQETVQQPGSDKQTDAVSSNAVEFPGPEATIGPEARLSMDRARVTAERALGKARRQMEDRPLVALAVAAAGCLAVGLAAGWFISFRRSK